MQVNRISNIGREAPAIDPATRPPAVPDRTDETAFNQSERLNKAVSDLPEMRGEEVARAKELVSSLKYPPDEMVALISRLLTGQAPESEQ